MASGEVEVRVSVALPPVLSPESVELLAASAHREWVEELRARGRYTYRRLGGEELMVPYSDLSDEERSLVVARVRGVVELLVQIQDTIGGLG